MAQEDNHTDRAVRLTPYPCSPGFYGNLQRVLLNREKGAFTSEYNEINPNFNGLHES